MFEKIINAHYRRPAGLLGRWIGSRMAQQHLSENEWTVQILNAQPGDHVLEIGFGPGLAVESLSRSLPDVRLTGIDYSRTMVGAARRRNARAMQSGRVDLRYGDVQHLPFEDATFDRVFSIHSIYFWPDAMQACREIHRVMKPGGTLALTLLPANRPEPGTAKFRPYTGQELEKLLSQTGFVEPHSITGDLEESQSNFAVVATK